MTPGICPECGSRLSGCALDMALRVAQAIIESHADANPHQTRQRMRDALYGLAERQTQGQTGEAPRATPGTSVKSPAEATSSLLGIDPDFTGDVPTDDYARRHWKGGTLRLDSDGNAELT